MSNAFNPGESAAHGVFQVFAEFASNTALDAVSKVIALAPPSCSFPVLGAAADVVTLTFGTDVNTIKSAKAVLFDGAAAPVCLADSTVTISSNVVTVATGITAADGDVVLLTIVVGG
jgi:hypothetical protein